MYALLAQIARFLPAALPAQAQPAHQLMESAEARAGHDPYEARRLRQAAQAWLSVVR